MDEYGWGWRKEETEGEGLRRMMHGWHEVGVEVVKEKGKKGNENTRLK